MDPGKLKLSTRGNQLTVHFYMDPDTELLSLFNLADSSQE